jgi:hypothetical protein
MTNTTPPPRPAGSERSPGYRGALPPRNDAFARVWVVVVAAVLVLLFVLPLFGVPSRLFPEPTAIPIPSVPASSASFDAVPSASP